MARKEEKIGEKVLRTQKCMVKDTFFRKKEMIQEPKDEIRKVRRKTF